MSGSLTSTAFVPTINFNEIPPAGALLVPGVYIEVAADYSNIGLLPFPARMLVIGQMRSGAGFGNGTVGTIYKIFRTDQAEALFGPGSPAAEMVAYALASNPGIPLDAVGLAPAVGNTDAAGSITFGGAAKYNGTQAIGLCGLRIPFTIQPSDTPAIMAANFIIAAQTAFGAQNLAVTLATNATVGQVAVTAVYGGTAGNQLDLRANPAEGDATVPGVTLAVVPIGSGTIGTGTADITAVIGAIATTWYTDIACAFNDPASLALLEAALISRYTAMQHVDSHCYVAFEGTQGQLAADVAPINNQFMSAIGFTNGQDPTWRWAGAVMGVAAQASLADPARQLRGLALPGIIAPARADRMYEPEQNALLMDGVATWDVSPSGTVLLQRLVTTYTQSNLGVPDPAWQDIMTAKVMTRIRWDWKNFLLLNWPRAKLADDGSMAAEYDPSIATAKRIQASWAGRCTLYERAGWIENSAATVAQSVFTRDPNDKNRLNSQRKLQIIGNLMIDAEQLLFAA